MLPAETVLALFPSAVVAGDLVLRPLTLAHMAAMETLGVDTRGSVTESQALLCGWILSLDPKDVIRRMCGGMDLAGFEVWAVKHHDPLAVLEAVKTAFRQGTAGYVPGKESSGGDKGHKVTFGVDGGDSGFGFPLEIAEGFAHEYSIPMDEALVTPLSRIFGMMACAMIRNGGEAGGPDYYERRFVNKVRVAKVAKALDDIIGKGGGEDGGGK